MNEDNNSQESGNFNQASSSFSNDEKKQERKEAVEKAGQVAARGTADYFTGGTYEKFRNAPVVGKVAQGAEKVVGKAANVANVASLGTLGRTADKLNKVGALDAADKAIGAMGGDIKGGSTPNASNVPKNTNPNPEAFTHSNSLDRKNVGENKPSTGEADNKKTAGIDSGKNKPRNLLPNENKTGNTNKSNETSITAINEEGSSTLKKVVGIKAIGCVIIFIMLGFVMLTPILLLAGGANISSVNSSVECELSGSEDCDNDESATFFGKVRNYFKYGTFGSNVEVVAQKVVQTYNDIYERYGFSINRELLIATLTANIDDLNVEYDKNNNETINEAVLNRLNYINEVAELQIIDGNTIYYCDVRNVDGKDTYYLSISTDYVSEDSVVRGSCNANNVGNYIRIAEQKYDEEEYYNILEKSNLFLLLYPDYENTKDIIIERIKSQYNMYKILNDGEEDVGNIPITLMSDPNVNLQVPLKGQYYITSPFGNRGTIYSGTNVVADGAHLGIDVVPYNDKNIYAAGNGIVTRANFESVGGNVIEITHTTSTGEKYISQYAHLDEFLVSVGTEVKAGDLIAVMGSTGAATGPHLHFGMKDLQNNEWLNPRNLFTGATNY